jgi:xylulokinase
MAETCLIGIDVGTTATKAVLIDARGKRLMEFARPHATARPGPGAAEQDPETWVESVLAALAQFSEQADLSGLAGIGFSSQVNTHVFTGADGMALRPAITWQDTRAAPDAAALEAQVTAEQKTEWFGGPVPIDASHALSRMAYVARTAPDIYAATRHVLLPKDYCIARLTGEIAADPVAAIGLVDRAGRYVPELLDLVPGAAERLPPLFPFQHVVGRVRAGLPCAGVPVVVGAMDAWAGMFGCGVVADGEAMLQSGTSEVPGIVSSRVVPMPGVILFAPYQDIVMHAAPTQAGGAAFAWLARLLNRTPGELSDLAADVPENAAIPLFTPHLSGERAPIWDSAARAGFAGIDAAVGPGEMALAVMEGVAHSVRWAFEALEASSGGPITLVSTGGGGARSDVWCQLKADVLGKTLRRTDVPDVAALGAAILAGVGSGVFAGLVPAVRGLVGYEREFAPNPARAAHYAERFARYRQLYEALRAFGAGN